MTLPGLGRRGGRGAEDPGLSRTRSDGWRLPGGPYGALGVCALASAVLVASPWPGVPEARRQADSAHFHHVHLNVTDPDSTVAFYETFFGAYPVRYRDRSEALFTERSFILMDEVSRPPPSNLGTALWHIGWAGVDGESEFRWRSREGIDVQTPRTSLGDDSYMYFWGPDRELVEIYTGSRNHRFEHLHLVVSNREATRRWFRRHLGLASRGSGGGALVTDNVNLILTELAGPDDERPVWYPDGEYPEGSDLGVTDGTAIDHVAFSYSELDPAYRRMRTGGADVVRPPEVSDRHGHRSFFVRAPDGLLVEIVEEDPIPQAIWREEE